jgi:hypothetical protein
MSMIRSSAFLLNMAILYLLMTADSFAQDSLSIFVYPSEKELDASLQSIVLERPGSYKYEYVLFNSPSSNQRVWELSIFNVPLIDSLNKPTGWDVGTSTVPAQRLTWAASDSSYDILPGARLPGFQIISSMPPSIKDFYATGWIEVPHIEVEPDSIVGGDFPENSFHGNTIGPMTTPFLLSPVALVDSLIYYTTRSLSLHWINTDSCATKYRQMFTQIRNHITKSDLELACHLLDTVLQQVQIDSPLLITPEAYTLICINSRKLKTDLESQAHR